MTIYELLTYAMFAPLGIVLRELGGIDEGMGGLGIGKALAKLDPTNKNSALRSYLQNPIKALKTDIRNALKGLGKTFRSLSKELQKLAHYANRYNPAFVLLRKGYLIALKINALDVANRIKYGSVSNLDADLIDGFKYGHLYGFGDGQIERLQKGFQTAWDIYYTMGGEYPAFAEAIYTNRDAGEVKYFYKGQINGAGYLADELVKTVNLEIKTLGDQFIVNNGSKKIVNQFGNLVSTGSGTTFEALKLNLYEKLRQALISKYDVDYNFYRRVIGENAKKANEALNTKSSFEAMTASQLMGGAGTALDKAKSVLDRFKARGLSGCGCQLSGVEIVEDEEELPFVVRGMIIPRPNRDYGVSAILGGLGSNTSLWEQAYANAVAQFDPNAEVDQVEKYDQEMKSVEDININEVVTALESNNHLGMEPATATLIGSAIATLSTVALAMICPQSQEECAQAIKEAQNYTAEEAKRRIAAIDKELAEKWATYNKLIADKQAEFDKNGSSELWLSMTAQEKELRVEIERLELERKTIENANSAFQDLEFDPNTGGTRTNPGSGNRGAWNGSTVNNSASEAGFDLFGIKGEYLIGATALGFIGWKMGLFKPVSGLNGTTNKHENHLLI